MYLVIEFFLIAITDLWSIDCNLPVEGVQTSIWFFILYNRSKAMKVVSATNHVSNAASNNFWLQIGFAV